MSLSAAVVVSQMERYQTFWPRFFAGFIDGLVFVPLSLVDVYLSAREQTPSVTIIWSGVLYSSYWLYSVLLHSRYGQTLGKMAMNVKVLDVSETRIPSFRQSFLRDIGFIILNTLSLAYLIYLVVAGEYSAGAESSSLPGKMLQWTGLAWFGLEVISMATNDKRRALHDFIAGTVVVNHTK